MGSRTHGKTDSFKHSLLFHILTKSLSLVFPAIYDKKHKKISTLTQARMHASPQARKSPQNLFPHKQHDQHHRPQGHASQGAGHVLAAGFFDIALLIDYIVGQKFAVLHRIYIGFGGG